MRLAGSLPGSLPVLTSPSMPAENFRIAGMTDPTVVVPEGATVAIALVNAHSGTAHGVVVARAADSRPWPPGRPRAAASR